MGIRTLLWATALTLAPVTAAHAQTEVATQAPAEDEQTTAPTAGDFAAPPATDDTPPAPEPPPPSRDPDDIPLIDLSVLETENLRLLYFDPSETYLTPYVGRSFENALAFQRRIFDWEPWDQVTLLLKDFGDYGNAAARSSLGIGRKPSSQSAALLACDAARTMARLSSRRTSAQEPM